MKMHVVLNVRKLEASLAFYRKLFDAEPTKVKENYAKFELNQPALHFSLNVRPYEDKGVLNHLGFQVDSKETVLAVKERLQKAGLVSFDEMDTTCCYAVQDKIWVTDPEGNSWEVFYTKADSEFESAEARSLPDVCCTPAPVQRIPVSKVTTSIKGNSCGCSE
ncbi:ArsI/CadI family heavy metal resistance metalloenzyme [Paenibacillus aurantius]|uniref:ArsI/CadI family heavy metal resistance metalloenzyme n=1 Tax=Paenibacillus aurantius TaxID=2918900 RepID=A0AA96L896_9BACL|nr:ArsI/CadI family heavy metal resistance metalloenzyme [Paenibacillus aurantius]WNQ08856.1 ArsI/CadI family heavy metal resistance metalloenzyme [Paenibacillus aurantius]